MEKEQAKEIVNEFIDMHPEIRTYFPHILGLQAWKKVAEKRILVCTNKPVAWTRLGELLADTIGN